MTLVEKLKKHGAEIILLAGLGATAIVSHKVCDYTNAKVLSATPFPITIAYDNNRDGTPDFVMEGWIARAGGGYYSDMRTRPATQKEIGEYQSK